jgi:flagellar motor switch protein FliN/FliY
MGGESKEEFSTMTPTTNPTTGGSTPPAPSSSEMKEVLAKLADFLQLAPGGAGAAASLNFLEDVSLTVTARLGQVTLPINDILKLGPGAVVELDREVGQPVDLAVQGTVFARGEVVVVDDHFAIRIKELLSPKGAKLPR